MTLPQHTSTYLPSFYYQEHGPHCQPVLEDPNAQITYQCCVLRNLKNEMSWLCVPENAVPYADFMERAHRRKSLERPTKQNWSYTALHRTLEGYKLIKELTTISCHTVYEGELEYIVITEQFVSSTKFGSKGILLREKTCLCRRPITSVS